VVVDAFACRVRRPFFLSIVLLSTNDLQCLLEPGFVLQPQCNDTARKLQDSDRQFYDDKYKSHFDGLLDAISTFFSAMGNDPLNARFGQDWVRLTKDLLFDSEGDLKFKPEPWRDIRKVILPSVTEKVGYIPIPCVEYTDDVCSTISLSLDATSSRRTYPRPPPLLRFSLSY
jgi:hypothetical protein